MNENFVVHEKTTEKKEDKFVTLTIRWEKELQDKFDELSTKSGRSRNELIGMALRYALDHIEFIPAKNSQPPE